MNKNRYARILCILIAVTTLLATGCSTINHLDEHDIYGSKIAMDMAPAPEPEVNVDYENIDFEGDKLLAMIQLGTNIVKAGEAEKAEVKMKKALNGLYIPEYAAELTFDRIVSTLDGRMTDNINDADLILEVDIREYGLEANSFNGEVSMIFKMNARFYYPQARDVIWQRHVNIERKLTPGFFGFDNIVGNMVSISSLSKLEEEQMADGFKAVTGEVMRETIRVLKKDLRKARKK